jgi:hypothetical protein
MNLLFCSVPLLRSSFINDAMQLYKDRFIYVGLPTHGLLVVVHLDMNKTIPQRAVVTDQINVGGRPVRLLLAD